MFSLINERSMAALPILPMFSRTILEAAEQGVLPHVLRTVAMLAEDSSTVFFSHGDFFFFFFFGWIFVL